MTDNRRVYSPSAGGLKSEIRMPAGTRSLQSLWEWMPLSASVFPRHVPWLRVSPSLTLQGHHLLDESSLYLPLTASANTLPPNVVTFTCMLSAQSLQSCPTLCDPMDHSQPGSSVHGDSPAKNTEVGCHAFLQVIFPTQGSNPGLWHCR